MKDIADLSLKDALSPVGLEAKRKIRVTLPLSAYLHPVAMRYLNGIDVSQVGEVICELVEIGIRSKLGFVDSKAILNREPGIAPTAKVPTNAIVESNTPPTTRAAKAEDPMERMGISSDDFHSFVARPPIQ